MYECQLIAIQKSANKRMITFATYALHKTENIVPFHIRLKRTVRCGTYEDFLCVQPLNNPKLWRIRYVANETYLFCEFIDNFNSVKSEFWKQLLLRILLARKSTEILFILLITNLMQPRASSTRIVHENLLFGIYDEIFREINFCLCYYYSFNQILLHCVISFIKIEQYCKNGRELTTALSGRHFKRA